MNTDINPGFLGIRDIKAQCNYMITLHHADKQTEYLYTGDLWLSSPDIQYWSPPLQFDDALTPPAMLPMQFVERFALDV